MENFSIFHCGIFGNILELKYFCQKCQNSKSDRCFFEIRKSGNENIVRVSLLPGISQCVIGRVGLVLQLQHLDYIDQSQS